MITQYLLPDLRRRGGRAARGRRRADRGGHDRHAAPCSPVGSRPSGSSASRARDWSGIELRAAGGRRSAPARRWRPSPRTRPRPRWPRRHGRSAGRRCATWRRSAATSSCGAPYGDLGVVLLALDAEVDLGDRTVPIDDFWGEFRRAWTLSARWRSMTTQLRCSCGGRGARPTPQLSYVWPWPAGAWRSAAWGTHPVRSAGAEAHLRRPGCGGRGGSGRGRPADGRDRLELVPQADDRGVRAASPGGEPCRLRCSSSSSTGARPR